MVCIVWNNESHKEVFEFSLYVPKLFMHLKSMDSDWTTASQVLLSEDSS